MWESLRRKLKNGYLNMLARGNNKKAWSEEKIFQTCAYWKRVLQICESQAMKGFKVLAPCNGNKQITNGQVQFEYT